MRSRQLVAVPPAELTGRVDPSLLPESPQRDGSLFSLLEPVTRRARSTWGSSPRTPASTRSWRSIARSCSMPSWSRAQELVRSLKTPGDLVYVHNFDDPDSPFCAATPGRGRSSAARGDGDLLAGLQDRMPQLSEADDVQRSQARINVELENKTREIVQGLEASARHHGFGVRNVQVFQTFPILHGKPLSAEQFDVPDEGTKRVLQARPIASPARSNGPPVACERRTPS